MSAAAAQGVEAGFGYACWRSVAHMNCYNSKDVSAETHLLAAVKALAESQHRSVLLQIQTITLDL